MNRVLNGILVVCGVLFLIGLVAAISQRNLLRRMIAQDNQQNGPQTASEGAVVIEAV